MLDRRLFISNVDELVRIHGDRLRSLCGQTIQATWIAWDRASDEWLPEEAVILDLGSEQLEIVWWKFDEVALTWHSIDVSTRPAWMAEWDESFVLAWRRDALPALASVVGKTITGVSIVEYGLQMRVIKDGKHPEYEGKDLQTWILSGLEFELGADRLQIYNALDQNGVTVDPPNGPEFRRIRLA